MYIKKLTIQNYRNFGDPAFELPLKPFTLILGENNVGKTNLLNALCLLLGQELSVTQSRMLQLEDVNYQSTAQFRKQVTDTSIASKDVRFPEVIVDAVLTDMNEDQESVVGDWFIDSTFTDAQITYRFSLRSSFDGPQWVEQQREFLRDLISPTPEDESDLPESTESQPTPFQTPKHDDLWQMVDFPIGEYRYVVYGGGRPSNECESHLLQMLKIEQLDALRDAQRELVAGGERRLLYRILRQGHDSKYADLKRRLLALEESVRNDDALIGIRNDVAALLKRVSLQTEDHDNSIDFIFSSPDTADLLKKIGMIYGADPIKVDRNGLGRNNLLYISLVLSQIARLHSTTEMSSNESPTCFRVVGIEEPEAHLHPHLQDHLGRNIEAIREEHSDTMQLILTSHSTHIAAKLSLENTAIIFSDTVTGTLKTHYVLEGIDEDKEKDAIRFLSLYLDATKSRMFFARRLILCEGISEQTLIPRLFELHKGDTLERYGATIINVNGVAFSHFLKVVQNGYFLESVVLTDSDSDTETDQRPKDLKNDYDDGSMIKVAISEKSTFEMDVIAFNRNGSGKLVLLDALTMTRPRLGKTLKMDTGDGDIDVEKFFSHIEQHKAAFAFNLAKCLERDGATLVLPEYIKQAFEFLV